VHIRVFFGVDALYKLMFYLLTYLLTYLLVSTMMCSGEIVHVDVVGWVDLVTLSDICTESILIIGLHVHYLYLQLKCVKVTLS